MKTFSLNNQLGDLLKTLRLQRDWSLRTAAEESGVSHTYISNLEKGLVPKPAPEQLKKLAAAYDHSYNVIMILAGYKEEFQKAEEFIELHSDTDQTYDENYWYSLGEEYFESLKEVSISEPNDEWLVFSEKPLETIGHRVKLLRIGQNLKINDMSIKLTGRYVYEDFTAHTKFSPTYIESVEKGKEEPSVSFLNAICDHFDVSMDWLVRGKQHTKREVTGDTEYLNKAAFEGYLIKLANKIIEEVDTDKTIQLNLNNNIIKK